MASEAALGRTVFAIALLGFGGENILFGRYVVARVPPWPDDAGLRFGIACVTGAVFLGCGSAMLVGRGLRVAGVLAAALIAGWSALIHLPVAIAGPAWSGDWTNVLKAATLAAGAIGVAAADERPMRNALRRLRIAAPHAAGAFFLLCGIQHFLFADFVATLIPPFIPWPYFWTYVAGVLLFAAGVGFWTAKVRHAAATLTAVMVFSWVFLVHVPLVFAIGRDEWMGVVEALGISGVCLVLARPPRGRT